MSEWNLQVLSYKNDLPSFRAQTADAAPRSLENTEHVKTHLHCVCSNPHTSLTNNGNLGNYTQIVKLQKLLFVRNSSMRCYRLFFIIVLIFSKSETPSRHTV